MSTKINPENNKGDEDVLDGSVFKLKSALENDENHEYNNGIFRHYNMVMDALYSGAIIGGSVIQGYNDDVDYKEITS